jgi:hypothetical protein
MQTTCQGCDAPSSITSMQASKSPSSELTRIYCREQSKVAPAGAKSTNSPACGIAFPCGFRRFPLQCPNARE